MCAQRGDRCVSVLTITGCVLRRPGLRTKGVQPDPQRVQGKRATCVVVEYAGRPAAERSGFPPETQLAMRSGGNTGHRDAPGFLPHSQVTHCVRQPLSLGLMPRQEKGRWGAGLLSLPMALTCQDAEGRGWLTVRVQKAQVKTPELVACSVTAAQLSMECEHILAMECQLCYLGDSASDSSALIFAFKTTIIQDKN